MEKTPCQRCKKLFWPYEEHFCRSWEGALGPWFDSCEGNIVETGDELHQVLGDALRAAAVPSTKEHL